MFDQFSGVEHHPQVGEELAGFAITRDQVFETPMLLEAQFLHPIEWEPIQYGGVKCTTSDLEELPFEALIRLREERQQHSSSDSVEAYPHPLPRTLDLKEV